jgi:hypothetical protein
MKRLLRLEREAQRELKGAGRSTRRSSSTCSACCPSASSPPRRCRSRPTCSTIAPCPSRSSGHRGGSRADRLGLRVLQAAGPEPLRAPVGHEGHRISHDEGARAADQSLRGTDELDAAGRVLPRRRTEHLVRVGPAAPSFSDRCLDATTPRRCHQEEERRLRLSLMPRITSYQLCPAHSRRGRPATDRCVTATGGPSVAPIPSLKIPRLRPRRPPRRARRLTTSTHP